MKYRLNGKEISRREYLRIFQGMAEWIDANVQAAVDDGEEIPMFKTGLGPLVIIAE